MVAKIWTINEFPLRNKAEAASCAASRSAMEGTRRRGPGVAQAALPARFAAGTNYTDIGMKTALFE
jgi:hypothetical protein